MLDQSRLFQGHARRVIPNGVELREVKQKDCHRLPPSNAFQIYILLFRLEGEGAHVLQFSYRTDCIGCSLRLSKRPLLYPSFQVGCVLCQVVTMYLPLPSMREPEEIQSPNLFTRHAEYVFIPVAKVTNLSQASLNHIAKVLS
jgi:hypothetical protein